MFVDQHTNDKSEITLEDKVAFLRSPDAYPSDVDSVIPRETHMSWVFLAGNRVYKLKKPLCSPFLDFSNAERREAACREEFRLNRRLAKETYLDVAPLTFSKSGLAIGGQGRPVDWLVVMRRLNERRMLEELIVQRRLRKSDLGNLAMVLADFYHQANPSRLAPEQQIAEWKRGLRYNRQVLLTTAFELPGGLIRQIERSQEEFLSQHGDLFIERNRARLIVDAHGDLRPEHIWLGDPIQIIDCLEFNQRLRTLDALSEIAFLDLECERLGSAWAGKYLRTRLFGKLPKLRNDALFRFYRSYHAMLRARLAIAHLFEPHPRKPEKWRPLALSYLRLASIDAGKLPDYEA
jgi:aminoglycoside phosphotransferase family enzyme